MTTKEDTTRTLPGRSSPVWPVAALFRLTFVQIFRTRQVVLLVVVLLLPVLFSLYWSLAETLLRDVLYIWGIIFVVAYLNFIVPFLALLYGTMLISSEREAHTLTYLVTRPVPRWLVALVKYAAAAVVCLAGIALSMFIAYTALGLKTGIAPVVENLRYWVLLAGVAGIAMVVYLALFFFVGMRFRRPAVIGLVFIVVWEWFVGLVPGIIRFVTLVHYPRSLAILATRKAVTLPRFITVREAPLSACLVVLGTLWVAFLAFSLWHFGRAESQPTSDRL